jgi:hypothetical protein
MRTPPSCQALLATMLLVAACGGARVNAATTGPVERRLSDASQREQVSITLYEDFGLVREIRNVDLARGKVALELRDVAAQIQPETVHIQSSAESRMTSMPRFSPRTTSRSSR